MNKCIFIGNLTKDVEYSTTGSGLSMCRFDIAVRRDFKNENNEYEVDFFKIVAWRKLAENCHKYLSKGKKVCVVCRAQNDTFIVGDEKKHITNYIASDIEFLSPLTENYESNNIEKEEVKQDDFPF